MKALVHQNTCIILQTRVLQPTYTSIRMEQLAGNLTTKTLQLSNKARHNPANISRFWRAMIPLQWWPNPHRGGHFAECQIAKNHFAECQIAECHFDGCYLAYSWQFAECESPNLRLLTLSCAYLIYANFANSLRVSVLPYYLAQIRPGHDVKLHPHRVMSRAWR